jgi:hypothetical protein
MMPTIPLETLFGTLKAENEPWLSDIFVSLPVFERLFEPNSTILYGEAGSGKTALRLEMTKKVGQDVFTPLWIPESFPENQPVSTALAIQAMRQALRACVEKLVGEADLPRRLGELPDWVASAMQCFLRTYLPFDPNFYVQSKEGKLNLEEIQWYLALLKKDLPPMITDNTSLNDQVRLLLSILRQAGYPQLWLCIDGLERWMPFQAGRQVENFLDAILSTTMVFDVPGAVIKFFIPAMLHDTLKSTVGVEKLRAKEIHQEWSEANLCMMLEKRLAQALGLPAFSIGSIVEGDEFLSWLKVYGGKSPREWLQLTEPFAVTFRNIGKPLSAEQARQIWRQHPPILSLDHDRREVWIGRKRISIGSVIEFRLLEYLAAHPGKICTLEELYYYAQEQLDYIPDSDHKKWAPRLTWRSAMDTLVWRLRQKIEQDPKAPLYLITHPRKGLELLHFKV